MSLKPPVPANESLRIAALQATCLLDTPPDPAFDLITSLAAKTFDVPIALITLVDTDRQWFKSNIGLAVSETPRDVAFCAYAIHLTEPMIVLDTHLDERFVDHALVLADPYIRFYAGAPLINSEGYCLGTLCIIDTTPRSSFSEYQMSVLKHMASMAMTRIETLRTIGYVDPITLLPNRTRFVADLQSWMSAEHSNAPMLAVAIDFCGVSYFATVEQALGSDYAEGYLNAVKERLVERLTNCAVYRIGVTLFAFVQELGEELELDTLLKELPTYFDSGIEHLGIPHNTVISVAAVRLNDEIASTDVVRALASTANIARSRGAGHALYERRPDDAQRSAFRLLAAVPSALTANDQLTLHYQPKVNLLTGECVGVEALIRWNHPSLGMVSPAMWIPLAEKTALMRRVTSWVLNAGFSQAERWQAEGRKLTIALNVSAIDLDQEGFVARLQQLLDRYKVSPELLELEFTESAVSINPKQMRAQLKTIRSMGFHLSIDDFGTGHSNLTYLKRLPATAIKIDQSFIKYSLEDEKSSIIVHAVIDLAHRLGTRVIAEGIESEEIYEAVAGWGCDEGQGYWIAKPMPLADFEAWLNLTHSPTA